MKRFNFVLILFAMLGCAQPNDQSKDVEQSNFEDSSIEDVEAIKGTLIEMWDAVEKNDVDRYSSFVHPDFTQFGEYDSALRIGKTAEVEGMRMSMEKSVNVHTEMIDPRITVKGDVAWIVYYWSDSGLSNEAPFATHGKSTRIFVKENGKWLCIHGHYTLLPAQ